VKLYHFISFFLDNICAHMPLNGDFIYKDEVNTIKIRLKNGEISQIRSLRGTMTRGMYYYYYILCACVRASLLPARIHVYTYISLYSKYSIYIRHNTIIYSFKERSSGFIVVCIVYKYGSGNNVRWEDDCWKFNGSQNTPKLFVTVLINSTES